MIEKSNNSIWRWCFGCFSHEEEQEIVVKKLNDLYQVEQPQEFKHGQLRKSPGIIDIHERTLINVHEGDIIESEAKD